MRKSCNKKPEIEITPTKKKHACMFLLIRIFIACDGENFCMVFDVVAIWKQKSEVIYWGLL